MFLLLTVEGMELGRYLYTTRTSDVSKLIMKQEDSDEVRDIKNIIVKMLALEPSDRPPIQEVIDHLSQLRTSLGVHVLISVDTIWKSPRFYSELAFTVAWNAFLPTSAMLTAIEFEHIFVIYPDYVEPH